MPSAPPSTPLGKVFLQSLSAISFDLAGTIAGLIVSLTAAYAPFIPWILVIYPPLLTVRGNINGILCGRLSTYLHLGLVKPSMRNNTSYYYSLTASIYSMSLVSSIMIGFFSYGLTLLFMGGDVDLPTTLSFAILAMVTCASLSAFLLTPLTAFKTFKIGADPDILLYPIMSTVNDILISSFYVFFVFLFLFLRELFSLFSKFLIPVFVVVAFYFFVKYWREDVFKETFREGMPTVILLTVMSNMAGIILSNLKDQIAAFPQLLAVYPALIDTIGDEGSIIASSTSTKLALGYIEPRISNLKHEENKKLIFSVIVAGLIVSVSFTLIASLFYTRSIIQILRTIITVVAAKLITMSLITLFAFGVAIATFKRGLNPDNIAIPAITSSSDTVTTIMLTLTVTLLM